MYPPAMEPYVGTSHEGGDTEPAAGIFEEYRSLRQEILQAQQSRLYILGFASTAVGVVLGIAPLDDTGTPDGPSGVGLVLFGQLIILAAGILTVQRGQAIVGIAEYLRVFVERPDVGIAWESRTRHLQRLQPRRRYRMGASRSFASYYFIVSLSLAGIGVSIAGLEWMSAPIIVLAILDLLPCLNLWRQRSKGWKFGWDSVHQAEASAPVREI